MTPTNSPDNPRIVLKRTEDYRDSYANSVQVRLSVWDFLLVFGTLAPPQTPEQVEIENFQGVYLSPQQAKALHNILGINLAQYEQTFGPIALEPTQAAGVRFVPPNGPVH
jgi:flagellar protein FlaG